MRAEGLVARHWFRHGSKCPSNFLAPRVLYWRSFRPPASSRRLASAGYAERLQFWASPRGGDCRTGLVSSGTFRSFQAVPSDTFRLFQAAPSGASRLLSGRALGDFPPLSSPAVGAPPPAFKRALGDFPLLSSRALGDFLPLSDRALGDSPPLSNRALGDFPPLSGRALGIFLPLSSRPLGDFPLLSGCALGGFPPLILGQGHWLEHDFRRKMSFVLGNIDVAFVKSHLSLLTLTISKQLLLDIVNTVSHFCENSICRRQFYPIDVVHFLQKMGLANIHTY